MLRLARFGNGTCLRASCRRVAGADRWAGRLEPDSGHQAGSPGGLRAGVPALRGDPRAPCPGPHHPADHAAVRRAGRGQPVVRRGGARPAAAVLAAAAPGADAPPPGRLRLRLRPSNLAPVVALPRPCRSPALVRHRPRRLAPGRRPRARPAAHAGAPGRAARPGRHRRGARPGPGLARRRQPGAGLPDRVADRAAGAGVQPAPAGQALAGRRGSERSPGCCCRAGCSR